MIALIDVNNCYVSCHRFFEKELRFIPVAILSNNDACVIARSNEAKALGIQMGDAYFLSKLTFEEKGVAVRSSNYALYADMHKRLVATIEKLSPLVEVYSIDEVFADLGKMQHIKDLHAYGVHIRQTINKHVGLPTGIGIAPSKTLAKAANKYAKKVAPDGVFVMDSEEKREMVLQWTKLEDVWGVGSKLWGHLDQYGFKTAWDLSKADAYFLQKGDGKRFKGMGVKGLRMLEELNGKPTSPVMKITQLKKNITTGRSFPEDVYDYKSMSEAVALYTTRCGEQLRAHRACAQVISVGIITNTFRDNLPQHSIGVPVELPVPTNSTRILNKYAQYILSKIWKKGYGYKKVVVDVTNIVPRDKVQYNLFSTYDHDKDNALMAVMDKINGKMGQDKMRLARIPGNYNWGLKREFLSPCYTTNFHELVTIRI